MPAIDAIGLKGPSYQVDIERGKIRDFAKAMGAPLPEFVTGDRPIMPAMFLITAPYTWGYSLERPRGTVFSQIDHDLSVPLHAEESLTFFGPMLQAGARLTAQGSVEDVRVKKGRQGGELTFLTMLTTYHDHTGRLVAEQRSVTVTTGQSPDEGGWAIEIPPYVPYYTDIDPDRPFIHISRTAWDDISAGDLIGPINLGPLMMRDIVRFQGVVGEDNPLHYDLAWAQAHGYPNVFGLGTHQASMLTGLAAYRFDPAAVRQARVRFRNVYWPGEEMVYQVKVDRKYIDDESGHRMLALALHCTRPPGDPIVDGWMTLDFDYSSE